MRKGEANQNPLRYTIIFTSRFNLEDIHDQRVKEIPNHVRFLEMEDPVPFHYSSMKWSPKILMKNW